MGLNCCLGLIRFCSDTAAISVIMTLLEQEDNEVDTETLQSQIDLSMSLVHDLVSSWVKPAPRGTKQSNYDAQKDLEEYMRRPARCVFCSILLLNQI